VPPCKRRGRKDAAEGKRGRGGRLRGQIHTEQPRVPSPGCTSTSNTHEEHECDRRQKPQNWRLSESSQGGPARPLSGRHRRPRQASARSAPLPSQREAADRGPSVPRGHVRLQRRQRKHLGERWANLRRSPPLLERDLLRGFLALALLAAALCPRPPTEGALSRRCAAGAAIGVLAGAAELAQARRRGVHRGGGGGGVGAGPTWQDDGIHPRRPAVQESVLSDQD